MIGYKRECHICVFYQAICCSDMIVFLMTNAPRRRDSWVTGVQVQNIADARFKCDSPIYWVVCILHVNFNVV